MNKFAITTCILFLAGCSATPASEKQSAVHIHKSELETQTILFESSCIKYYDGLIERKIGDDKSPEARKKWEDTLYKDYRFAKDEKNSEAERSAAMKKANLMCNVQQRMNL